MNVACCWGIQSELTAEDEILNQLIQGLLVWNGTILRKFHEVWVMSTDEDSECLMPTIQATCHGRQQGSWKGSLLDQRMTQLVKKCGSLLS